MKLTKIICVLLFLTIIFTTAGCAEKKQDGVIRVVLDWTPNTNHTGMYVALEKGWYKDAGLAVELMQPPEDGALTLVAAGGAEFGVDFQESMGPAIASDAPLPVTAVAAIINHNTSGIMSLKSSGITSPRHLEGKRFATWGTPLVDAIIRSVVEADGGVFDKVGMVPNNATDAVSALQTDVDAIWVYRAWDGVAADLSIETDYLAFKDLNPVFDFYTPVLVANNEFIASNAETARKFIEATSKGYDYATENPADAAEILCKAVPELDPVLVLASQEYLAGEYKAGAARWGEIDPGRWNAFYNWMLEQGLLEKDIRDTGFTNEFLPG